MFTDRENLKFLKDCTKEYLEHHTFGIDRGVVRPVQFGAKVFNFADEQKRKVGRDNFRATFGVDQGSARGDRA